MSWVMDRVPEVEHKGVHDLVTPMILCRNSWLYYSSNSLHSDFFLIVNTYRGVRAIVHAWIYGRKNIQWWEGCSKWKSRCSLFQEAQMQQGDVSFAIQGVIVIILFATSTRCSALFVYKVNSIYIFFSRNSGTRTSRNGAWDNWTLTHLRKYFAIFRDPRYPSIFMMPFSSLPNLSRSLSLFFSASFERVTIFWRLKFF